MFTPYSSRKWDRKQRCNCWSFSRTSKVRANRCPAWSVNTWANREMPFGVLEHFGTYLVAVASCRPAAFFVFDCFGIGRDPRVWIPWQGCCLNLRWIQIHAMDIAQKNGTWNTKAIFNSKTQPEEWKCRPCEGWRWGDWSYSPRSSRSLDSGSCIPMHSMHTRKIQPDSSLMIADEQLFGKCKWALRS